MTVRNWPFPNDPPTLGEIRQAAATLRGDDYVAAGWYRFSVAVELLVREVEEFRKWESERPARPALE